ncbi:uncharacterized protein LOC126897801 [Daktulosphaira vitifoliae]|uniref:uncharacterized protein LOC126897801 n=1 Tax=Daktulosphaira vitifoliae TaxID=58002 RepID=UPI0021AA04D4|nr:uncharacterized protein LOC126897801 [Daktulosphaira vitifoliae]
MKRGNRHKTKTHHECSCCFEAISNKTETIKHCKSIFCKSCILSSLKIKGNTNCLICSVDVITTTCHLCDSIIPEDHGKIYLTKCCKKDYAFHVLRNMHFHCIVFVYVVSSIMEKVFDLK